VCNALTYRFAGSGFVAVFALGQSAEEKQIMELALAFEMAMNTKDATEIAMVEKHAADSRLRSTHTAMS